jgi:tetratricopeptide (TPR) repeat protein
MKRFFRELRRREVFRTAGLYVGVCWILIEVSSVMLPTFDAPEWILQAIVIATGIGFPVMLALAWVYDVSDAGLHVQSDPTDTIAPPVGSRKMDFIVIGILSVALVLSLYMNVTQESGEDVEVDLVSVLIADFDNQTGDPLFEGSLEQALGIGIEGASFITAYNRVNAKNLVEKLAPGSELDADGARLVAIREGVKIILAGTISEDDGQYRLQAEALRPEGGEPVSSVSVKAKSKLEVLTAVSELADELREDLGDTTTGGEGSVVGETFTATSLEVLQNYAKGQELALSADYEGSLPYYAAALESDPDFGRALSGSAVSLLYLGRQEEAAALWEQALSKMDSMTARERYRTLGLYYVAVTGNYEKAIENYSALVEQYPADSAGYNNLAVAYFSTLDFAKAREAGASALEIYPTNKIMMSNFALYAMYAGDFDAARTHGMDLLDADEQYFMAWIPVAMSYVAADDIAGAKAAYDSMYLIGGRAENFADLGKTDLQMFAGDHVGATESARASIEQGVDVIGQRTFAINQLMLAHALAESGDADASASALGLALETTGSSSIQAAAALVYVDIEMSDKAAEIQSALSAELQSHARAYGGLIDGVLQMSAGNDVAAIDALRAAMGHADLWLVRYYLGRAYLQAGYNAEAMAEFATCRDRQGEATAIFLDDLPSWRYTATLDYWLGRSQSALGMNDAAAANFHKFTARYATEHPLSVDAASRIN